MDGFLLIDVRWLLWAGALLYAGAFILELKWLLCAKLEQPYLFTWLLVIGFCSQSSGLYWRGLSIEGIPLTSPFEILQGIAWCSIALVLLLKLLSPIKLLRLFGSGLACILGYISLQVPSWDYTYLGVAQTNPWIPFHVVLAILSYSIFGLVALIGLMYLIQDYGLSNKRGSHFFDRFPSLGQLDHISERLLLMGVVLLSAAMILGTSNWLNMPNSTLSTKLFTVWGVWLGYSGLWVLKRRQLLMPATFSKICLIFFIGVLLSLWPLNHSLPGIKEPIPQQHG